MASSKQFCLVRHVTARKPINSYNSQCFTLSILSTTMCQPRVQSITAQTRRYQVPGKKMKTFVSSILERSQTSIKRGDFQGKKKPDKHDVDDNRFPQKRVANLTCSLLPVHFKDSGKALMHKFTLMLNPTLHSSHAPGNEKTGLC